MAAVFALDRLGKVNPETERKTITVLHFYFLKIFFLIFFFSLWLCVICAVLLSTCKIFDQMSHSHLHVF